MANKKGDNAAEGILSSVAYVILIGGIIISLIFGVGSISLYGFAGILIILLGSIFSFIAWASCMVIINISNNLREVKHLLEKQSENDSKN